MSEDVRTPARRRIIPIMLDVIGRVLWAGAAFSAVISGVNFLATHFLNTEISAPQEAALAAVSLVWTIVPYVVARAWDEITRPRRAARGE